ncbi:hypothetical protein F4804DRAFT_345065 [Jackrogersella minutella]|nr:hypothetical protein F4804DRAFT_345065 [Jackrogersella minutella]
MNRIKEALARIARATRGPKEPSSSSSLRLDRVGRSSSSTLDSRERDKALVRADGKGPLILFDGCQNGDDGFDIVFVHGLFGSRSGTWTKGGLCYPRDFLGLDIPEARIIAWGWTGALSNSGTFSDQAELLLADLARLRTGITRPIVFIGHGIGGLVVKEALVTAAMSRIYGAHVELGNIYPRTIGCLFLGTPHQRSGKRSLGECIAATALLSPTTPNPQLLRAFKENDKAFENMHATFTMISRDIRVVCIRERLPSTIAASTETARDADGMELGNKGSMQMMVPRDSAAYESFNVTRYDMIVNHLDLARFKSRDEPGYEQMLIWITKSSSGPTTAELEAREPRNQEILNTIYYDTMTERESRIDPAYGQTCDWIMSPKNTMLPDFLRSKDPVLWISGTAGSGKSTVMKHIARSEKVKQQLLEGWASDGELLLACFFMFEGGNRIQKSYEGFLRSILYQILSVRRDLIRVAFPSFFECDWPPPVLFTSINNLNQGWYSVFAHMSDTLRLFVFIDGIDEYRIMERKDHYEQKQLDIVYDKGSGDESWGQSKWAVDSHIEISKLINSMGSKDNIKFVVSSRELPVFAESFAEYPRIKLQEHTERSISQYVAGRLEDEVPGLPDTKNLCKELAQKSRGDILWARLAIDMVIGSSLRTLRSMLDSLPTHLGGPDGLYMRMLENLSPDQQQVAYKIFHLVLSAHQPPSLITLSFAEEGYVNRTGELKIITDNTHPYDAASIQHLTDQVIRRLNLCCASLLVAEAGPSNDPNTIETGQRVVFVHQTAKEWIRRKDIWLRLPGCRLIDDVEYYFSLLSGCARHIKIFALFRPPILAWPSWRFRPGAWLLIANAMRYAERVDRLISDVQSYCELMDELDNTCQRIWVAALQNHKPLHEDPDWYESRLPNLCRKHWASYEPMDAGRPPKRKDFLSFAVQANLIRYTATKLSRLSTEARRKKAQELLPFVVSPKAEGFSACAGLSGEYLDFHHDMPDTRILDVLFDAGASPRDDDRMWIRALKAGRHYFSRGSLTMTHLLETSSSARLMDNRERWVMAIKSLLRHGADPHCEIQVTTGSGENQSTMTVAAVDLIRETLEGEPEYAVELVEMETLMGRRGSVGIAR